MAQTNETKRIPAIDATISEDLGTLLLTFANGEKLTLHVSQLTPAIGAHALMHGLKQKLVDAAAISRNPETGRSATIEDKYEAVLAVYERLVNPTNPSWNKPRESAAAVAGGLLFKALCRMYADKNPEFIRAFLAKKSDEEKAALRKNPRVAAIIEEIKAENAKEIDASETDAMLDELGALE